MSNWIPREQEGQGQLCLGHGKNEGEIKRRLCAVSGWLCIWQGWRWTAPGGPCHLPPASGVPFKAPTSSVSLAGAILRPGQVSSKAEQEGRKDRMYSRRWANRSNQCPAPHGAHFWGSQSIDGGQEMPNGSRKGQERALSGTGCFSDATGSGGGSSTTSVPTGWTGHRGCLQGWWHWPGRLEALSVYPAWSGKPWQLSQQSALLSTLLPAGPSLGSLRVRHPTGLGHTQSQHGAKAKPSPSQEPATPG